MGALCFKKMSSKAPFISFPEGYLGGRPAKFELIHNSSEAFAISKPAGIASFQHSLELGKPDISMALRRELLAGKPQLSKLGVEGVYRAYNLEAGVSGVLLFAKNEENEEVLKNAFGSRQLLFRYHLLAKVEGELRERFCDLPIARHSESSRMLVSHKTGKKCETKFRYLRHYGSYQLWEAETRDMRMHQLRIHASECGISIVGETKYSSGGQVYLSRIKKGYRKSDRNERPLNDGICIHLLSVRLEFPEAPFLSVEAPLPSRFSSLLRRLEEGSHSSLK